MRILNYKQLLIIAVAFISITSCKKEAKTKPVIPTEVKVITVGKTEDQLFQNIGYSGVITANKTINLTFQVSGTVERIPVQMGEYIKKGALIAAIDGTTYKSQYQAQYAQVELAKENYERILTVYEKGSIAEIRMIEARSKYNQAQAAAGATYQNLKHTKIVAPISGYIGDKMMEMGDVANPGQPVVQLLDIATVKVAVPIPDNEINNYQSGNKAVVRIDALDGEEFQGTVDEVSVISSSGNPTYTANVNIDNTDRRIKPGMTCTIVIEGNEDKPETEIPLQFVVPIESVYVNEKNQNFIYVVDTLANKAISRAVVTGKLYDNGIAITQGLKKGEKIVVSGYHKLTNNSPVKILN